MTLNLATINSPAASPDKAVWRPQAGAAEDGIPQARSASPSANSAATPAANAKPAGSNQDKTAENPNREAANGEAKAPDRQTLTGMVDELNERFKTLRQTGLQFNVDEDVDRLVVKVMDIEKDEVIRQIPPEEILELVAFLKERADREADRMAQSTLLAERGLAPQSSTPESFLLKAQV